MHLKKLAAFIITFVLAAEAAAPSFVFAEGEQDAGADESRYQTKGTYEFTLSESGSDVGVDEFVFDEECFRESSFTGCSHLALLSQQASNASTPYFGSKPDYYTTDNSDGSRNNRMFLSAMGFENVCSNAYYDMETKPYSIGVAAGSRPLSVKGETYTLIAVFPRSDGYRQEWCSDFKVGAGDVHEGFKESRDEVLRFLKKFIKDNNIKGKIKVWTSGHSRGAAVANMLAGFLAGGGGVYLGSDVSIEPEDVYCYTTATPSSIKDGAPKSEELSVGGFRGGDYDCDTEGEPFVYTGDEKVDLSDTVYGGIRHYMIGYDLITYLPPARWGFKRYGRACPVDGSEDIYGTGKAERTVPESEMLAVLKQFNPVIYDMFRDNTKDAFKWMTLDVTKMQIVEDPKAPADMDVEDMINSRVTGLIANAPTNKEYVEGGYQDAMIAGGGMFGMLFTVMHDGIRLNEVSTLQTVLKVFSAYSTERKNAEKAAGDGPAGVDPTVVNEKVNALLAEKVDEILMPVARKTKRIYGNEYYEQVCAYLEGIKENVNQARQMVSYMLFYTEGEKFSRQSSLRNAMTFINGVSIVTTTHYKEVYISWAKAVAAATKCEHHTGQAEYDDEQERQKREQEEKEKAARKAQKITLKISGGTVKRSTVKKKAVVAAVVKAKNAYGKVTFKKTGGSSKLTINSKTGKIKVRKGTPKGRYKIKIRVTAAGDSKYKAWSGKITATIRVK